MRVSISLAQHLIGNYMLKKSELYTFGEAIFYIVNYF